MSDTVVDERTLAVPGAVLHWYVRTGPAGSSAPALVIVGAPMAAAGFTAVAAEVGDRTVVTYDPRNSGRSSRDDPTAPVSADEHAADVLAVLTELRRTHDGPVDLVGSSGGAIVGLTLVQHHPDAVRTLVAHEPPLVALLPDADLVRVANADMLARYDAGGIGPAMARFIALVMRRGPLSPDFLAEPTPDPAAFGLPAGDDGSRSDPLMSNTRGGLTEVELDLPALRAAATRIVVGVGRDSGGRDDGELAARGAWALAGRLGTDAVVFPGGHNGFSGGEAGPPGDPAGFAATLRTVLAG